MTTTVEDPAVGREIVVQHEAAHAAADVLAGMIPHKIEVGPSGGLVTRDWKHHSIDRDLARGLLRSTLAGPLATGHAPCWPLKRTRSEDEKSIATLANYLGLDGGGYRRAVIETHELMGTREYIDLTHLFEYVLGELGVSSLDRDEIVRLLDVTGLDKHLRGGGAMKGVPMIKVIDRDGRPMRVRADWTPWWEEDEDLAAGTAKAIDDAEVATRNGKRHGPIQIKRFEV